MISPRAFPIRLHLLLFSLLVLAPTLFMSGMVTLRYARSARHAIEDVARDKAADLQRDFDRQVDVAVASLRAIATSPALDHAHWEALDQQVQALPQLAAGTLALYAEGDRPAWVSGNAAAMADGASVRGVWTAALGDGRHRDVAVSGFEPAGSGAGQIHIIVPVPRLDGSGGRAEAGAALLVWTIATSAFAGSIPALEPDWLGVVVDREFRILARSRDGATFVGRQASADFARRATGDAGTLESRTLYGVDVFTAYQRSPVTGWVALVSVPQAVLGRPRDSLLWSLVGLIATGAIASAAVGFAYSRFLGRDLHSLAADAAAVAGEREIPALRSRVSEVASVHRAMADAAGRLAEGRNQHRILLAELNHRVKNTLAVIQTLIGRTVTSGRPPEEASAALRGRVGALAAAHDALSDSEWHDPDLRQVVQRVLGARVALVSVSGPAIKLRPRTVVALSQALHEVFFQSLDAGALRSGRRPDVAWRWGEGSLVLRWTEPPGRDGPTPAPADFAATVIQLCIERQLGGHAAVEHTAAGLVMTWTIPGSTDLGPNLAPGPDGPVSGD